MRRTIVVGFALLLAASLALSGCCGALVYRTVSGQRIVGLGRIESRDVDVAGFSRVEASAAFRVDIEPGDSWHVTVSASSNVLDRVRVRTQGETLVIDMEPGYSFTLMNARAEITMPALEEIVLSGASTGTLHGTWESTDFAARASGASSLKGTVSAGTLRVDASGASRIVLDGTADSAYVQASGASTADLSGTEVGDIQVDLSGASRGSARVTGRIDAELSGASHFEYTGSPELGSVNTSGESRLQRR